MACSRAQQVATDARFAVTSLLMHAVWGIVVGLLYLPR